MKEITIQMINEWKMKNMDWMGYTLEKREIFSYHHLIIPKRLNGPATVDNCAILIQSARHDYLHIIERYDRKLFEYITSILVEVNRQHAMTDKEQLLLIREALITFEKDWSKERTNKGNPIVKERYLRRVPLGYSFA